MFLQFLQTLLGLLERLFGLAQSTEDDQGIPLGQVMTQVKQIRHARAAKTRVGQLDQRLGTVAHHVQDRRAKRRQALVRAVEPGVITSIRCHLFHPHLTRRQVHEYQHHLLQKGLIHRPNDWAYLAMGDAVLFPSRSDFQDETLQQVHQRSQGVGGACQLLFQVQTTEKRAERLGSHPTFEAELKQRGPTRRISQVRPCGVSQSDDSG